MHKQFRPKSVHFQRRFRYKRRRSHKISSSPVSDEATPDQPPASDIAPVSIAEEMKRSYLDYAMSVIVARALPDVRDGLKPVHRRILYSMHENGYDWTRAYRKCARVVGDVMGKYHPHGDASIYDALVRMAQDFSMRVPLIDGQGNFGSMDADAPAAMRYTECRLAEAAGVLLAGLDQDTVDFQPNYDDREHEPTVLPAQFPNLLVNGAGGIAVGMATNIPPHNLGEVIDACLAYIDDPSISVDGLMQHVPGPDFPTGALILGRGGARSAYHTGRGTIVVRGRHHMETLRREREAIIVTEVPFQVNKAAMVEKISEAVRLKKIEGIADLRDESDRDGVRVVMELKREAMAEVVLNQLYRFSPLQQNFSVNMLALNGGRPELLDLKRVIGAFVHFREEVVTRRTRHLLGKARDRAHVLAGLAIAVANIDEIIHIIRTAPDPTVARDRLVEREWPASEVEAMIQLIDDPSHRVVEGRYRLSEAQARAILDLRLQRLTGLGRDEIGDELKQVGASITDYLEILSSRMRLTNIVRDELIAVKARFATPRKTEIVEGEAEQLDEDLIQREDMVVTVSNAGYVKRVPVSAYRPQRRGGKGRAGMTTREEDFVTRVYVVNTHTAVLFFSTLGRVYRLKVYELPQGAPQARGKAMVNLLPLAEGETIATTMPLPDDESKWPALHVMFATRSGNVRRNALDDFAYVPQNGKMAMKLDEGDTIVAAAICTEQDDILLASARGKCIRFPVADVREFKSRSSDGVRGMRLPDGDRVISMSVLKHVEVTAAERAAYLRLRRNDEAEAVEPPAAEEAEAPAEAVTLNPDRVIELHGLEEFVLSITENGYGKRSSAYEYRVTGRGGSGIINIVSSARNGNVIDAFPVADDDQVLLATDGGTVLRTRVDDIRIAGRNTQGVILLDVAEGERVVSVARLPDTDATVPNGGDSNGEAQDEPGEGAGQG
jgi:DNA gyrase subunit A